MKKFLLFIVIGLLTIGAGVFYWYGTTEARIGNLNIYSGSVAIERDGEKLSGTTGSPLRIRDALDIAPESRAAIILKDGSVVRLEAGSRVAVAELEYQGEKIRRAVFKLTLGRLWSRVAPLPEGGSFEVETPTVVAAVRGTSFIVSYRDKDAVSEVYVEDNAVLVSLKTEPTRTKETVAGQVFTIRDREPIKDFEAGPAVAPAEYRDDWILFNQVEDEKSEAESSREASPAPGKNDASFSPPEDRKSSELSPLPIPPDATIQSQPLPKTEEQPPPTSLREEKKITAIELTAERDTAAINDPVALAVIARYSDGTASSPPTGVAWKQNPAIGTIDDFHAFRGFTSGKTSLQAVYDGIVSNSIVLHVFESQSGSTDTPIIQKRTLTNLHISYVKIEPSSEQTVAVSPGLPDVQWKAVAKYGDGSAVDVTNEATWSVEPGGTAKGSITATGYYRPQSQGEDAITASFDGGRAAAVITIP